MVKFDFLFLENGEKMKLYVFWLVSLQGWLQSFQRVTSYRFSPKTRSATARYLSPRKFQNCSLCIWWWGLSFWGICWFSPSISTFSNSLISCLHHRYSSQIAHPHSSLIYVGERSSTSVRERVTRASGNYSGVRRGQPRCFKAGNRTPSYVILAKFFLARNRS